MRFVSLIVCMMLAGTSYAEEKWYGLLTTDSIPLKNCVVIDAKPLSMRTLPITNMPPDNIPLHVVMEFRQGIEEDAKSKGFNAVIGFKQTFMGGAYEGAYKHEGVTYTKQPVVTGVFVGEGVMAKVRCK